MSTGRVRQSEVSQAIESMGLSTDAQPHERVCPQCETKRPLARFVMLPHDPRCNLCVLPDQSAAILLAKKQKADEIMRQLFSGVTTESNKSTSVSRLEGFLGAIYSKMGGMDEFTQLAAENIKHVLVERRGSALAINTITKLLTLNRDVDKHRLDEDVRMMTDEQLVAKARNETLDQLLNLLQTPQNADAFRDLVDLVSATSAPIDVAAVAIPAGGSA